MKRGEKKMNWGMYKLYEVNSYNDDGDSFNNVVLAQDEFDAVTEFYKDVNCKAYRKIASIEEIKDIPCILNYQIGRDIVDFTEKEWELANVQLGAGTWGRNKFDIICKDIKDDIKEMKFKSELVHSSGSQLELMICLADFKPNWVNF